MNNDTPLDQYIQKVFLESTHDIQSISQSDSIYRAICLPNLAEVIKNAMEEGYVYGLNDGSRLSHEEVTV
jgi:hypothetical protein